MMSFFFGLPVKIMVMMNLAAAGPAASGKQTMGEIWSSVTWPPLQF